LQTRNGPPIVRGYGHSMRFLVAASGLFTLLVLIAPVHPF
jgi:hypothetical protein